MNICIFSLLGISQDAPNWGGVRTHTKNLVSLLIKEGYKVTLIAGDGQHVQNGSLRIIPVGGGIGGRPDSYWFEEARKAFISAHENNPFQCVLSEGGGVRELMGTMKKLNLPVAVFTHSLSIHYIYNNWQEVDGFGALKSYIFRRVPRIIHDAYKMDYAFFRKCNMVITGSSRIHNHLKTIYRIDPRRVTVIHNWIETDVVKNDLLAGKRLRKNLNIPEKSIVFLLVGALWRPKGFRIVLHAFNDLLIKFPDVSLIIAGDGPDRPYFENYLDNRQSLRNHVQLLGFRRQDEMPSIYSAGDVFIMPSLLNEVLAYTLLEAMACEMPIIATSIFANQEALGKNGCFVPRNDKKSLSMAMLDFANNLSIKKAEAVDNRKRIESLFSYSTASKKINELITNLVWGADLRSPEHKPN